MYRTHGQSQKGEGWRVGGGGKWSWKNGDNCIEATIKKDKKICSLNKKFYVAFYFLWAHKDVIPFSFSMHEFRKEVFFATLCAVYLISMATFKSFTGFLQFDF